jgi:ABC-type Fe3+/spermidine/putrescine transport system ATPase subunit
VPEGRRLFPSLSVEENLLIGNYGRKVRVTWSLEAIYRLFPDPEGAAEPGLTSLSGGQQQMVAIGRALMSNPACFCATRSASASRRRHQGHLRRPPDDIRAEAARASSWWSRTSVRRWRCPTGSIACWRVA